MTETVRPIAERVAEVIRLTEREAQVNRWLQEDADFAILSRWREQGSPPLGAYEADALYRVDPESIYLRELRLRWGDSDWLLLEAAP